MQREIKCKNNSNNTISFVDANGCEQEESPVPVCIRVVVKKSLTEDTEVVHSNEEDTKDYPLFSLFDEVS